MLTHCVNDVIIQPLEHIRKPPHLASTKKYRKTRELYWIYQLRTLEPKHLTHNSAEWGTDIPKCFRKFYTYCYQVIQICTHNKPGGGRDRSMIGMIISSNKLLHVLMKRRTSNEFRPYRKVGCLKMILQNILNRAITNWYPRFQGAVKKPCNDLFM